MRWKGYKYHAKSDKGYHIAKNGHPPLVIKYVTYSPDGKLMDCPVFMDFRSARLACEQHYNEANQQTEEDAF